MEATNGTQPAEVSRVAVRLPPFWAERPAVWFAQAEAQFSLAGISTEITKFCHVISQLDHRYAAEVEDVITSPPQQDPYTKLKTKHGFQQFAYCCAVGDFPHHPPAGETVDCSEAVCAAC
jgi:hypothetical protein